MELRILRRRRGERILGSAAVALASLAVATEAQAATVTFEYTGASQSWTVPAGVASATFDVYGAAGGPFNLGGVTAPGGRATATFAVNPGDSYQVNVGQRGQGGGPAFGGGGSGAGGGGGGASDIRFGGVGLTERILVAGGGGGGSGACSDAGNFTLGGPGGGLTGGDATDPCGGLGYPGGGGTQTAGGPAGGDGSPGSFGQGGGGGQFSGGGGGGWYGGGGGSLSRAGGGGSGYGPPGTTFETGVRQGDGLITITYDDPPVDDPPRILSLAVNPNRFAAGKSDTPLSRRAGTGIEIELSEQASVRFRVRRDPRLRTGAPPPRRERAFNRELPAGASSVAFSGRLDGRAFKPGRYAVVARATDPSGQRSEKAVAAFRIRAG